MLRGGMHPSSFRSKTTRLSKKLTRNQLERLRRKGSPNLRGSNEVTLCRIPAGNLSTPRRPAADTRKDHSHGRGASRWYALRSEEDRFPYERRPPSKNAYVDSYTLTRVHRWSYMAPANPKYTRGGGPPVLFCLDQKNPLAKQKRVSRSQLDEVCWCISRQKMFCA